MYNVQPLLDVFGEILSSVDVVVEEGKSTNVCKMLWFRVSTWNPSLVTLVCYSASYL